MVNIKKNNSILLLLMLIFVAIQTTFAINFADRSSGIVLGKNSALNVKDYPLIVDGGLISLKDDFMITGQPIDFRRSNFQFITLDAFINGMYYAATTADSATIVLPERAPGETSSYFITNAGGLEKTKILVEKTGILRGQPLFQDVSKPGDTQKIELKDQNSALVVAIQNTLDTNVVMNGGMVILQDDLRLGDNIRFLGDGLVYLNQRRLALGGTESLWEGNLVWASALDLHLNSRIKLNGVWTFYGDGQINGNGNVLDISNGGKIILVKGSRLRMSGVHLKGLGSGNLILEEGAQLKLSDVEIEMDQSFNVDEGQIYIDGATNIVTKNNFLTFQNNGSLVIDRVPLTYDPVDYVDQFNIRPLRINDPEHKYISIINNGAIRRFKAESISFLDYSSDSAMQRYAVVMPIRPIRVFPEVHDGQLRYDFTVNGATNFLRFTKAESPVMTISDNVHVVYEHIVFQDFSPEYLSLGNQASLIFGNKSMVTLPADCTLNYQWTFQGDAILRGNGSTLTLGPNGAIVLKGENSSLRLEGITLNGVRDKNIRCEANSSKFIFKDVQWIQKGDFIFDCGSFDVIANWILSGSSNYGANYLFDYRSDQISTIYAESMIKLTNYIVFNYAPASSSITQPILDLIRMENGTAMFAIDNSTLSAPAPGMQLTKGHILVTGDSWYQNDNVTTLGQGIVFGDGTDENSVLYDGNDYFKLWSGSLEIK